MLFGIKKEIKDEYALTQNEIECIKKGIDALKTSEFDFESCLGGKENLKEITQSLNDISKYYNDVFKEIALKTSQLVALLIDTDYNQIRPIMENVSAQSEASSKIAANTQEINSSIALTAERASSIAQKSAETADFVLNGINQIEQMLQKLQSISEHFNTVIEKIDYLNNQMANIGEVVNIIGGIADQTNLLALNAAIESARAGEHGRGFAVVADEVRKLAEHTKDSAQKITSMISNAQGQTDETVNLINQVGESLNTSAQESEKATQVLGQVVEAVKGIDDEVAQIAAITQEQSASMHEVTNYINEVASSSEEVLTNSEQAGKALYGMGKFAEYLRRSIAGKTTSLASKEILELAKTDHLNWKWRIYNMIKGFEKINPDEILSPRECRLGRWYYDKDNPFKDDPDFIKIEEPHNKLHDLAFHAVKAYQEGKIEESENLLKDVEVVSEQIVEKIDVLINK